MTEDPNDEQHKVVRYKTLTIDNVKYKTHFTKKFGHRVLYEAKDPGKLTAFIPGTIIEVFVKEGKKVKQGEKLLILDAMKMMNEVMSPFDGQVKAIHVKPGDRVSKNHVMIELV
jgi:biotin carboxyl carrier protein